MTKHTSRQLTEAQQALLKHSTRNARKDAPRRRRQLIKPREQAQRYQREPVACVSCGAPREAHRSPVCDRCRERQP